MRTVVLFPEEKCNDPPIYGLRKHSWRAHVHRKIAARLHGLGKAPGGGGGCSYLTPPSPPPPPTRG